MSQIDGSILFCPLPDAQWRWKSFITSFGGQSAAIVLLGAISLTAPQISLKQLEHIELVAPAVIAEVHQKPAQPKPIPVKLKPLPRVQARSEFVAPPKITAPAPLPRQEVAIRTPLLAPPPTRFDDRAPAPKVVEHPLQTNVFIKTSEAPTLPRMAASKVQTGGFGDPNGVPVNPNSKGTGAANIAAVGSFDLPAGPGFGNGTGGARGVRGVVAGKFGDAIAPSPAPTASMHVQATNFDPQPVVEKKKAQQIKAVKLPVSIQEKPNPVYTIEARKLHVEGEVLLQVMFTATGQVRVLRVLHGLGHGLDEAAAQAAERIRFSPAQQEGRPVDSTATLHIVFQLS
jgi:TonB family protein